MTNEEAKRIVWAIVDPRVLSPKDAVVAIAALERAFPMLDWSGAISAVIKDKRGKELAAIAR